MNRLCEIALVADRYRHESVAFQESLDAPRGLDDDGPDLPQKLPVAGKSMVIRNQREHLPVAVVLHQPVGALPVHAARHEAVVALMRRVPADELQYLAYMSHAKQRGAHHGAVSDPGAGVAPRAGLQRGPRAGDEDMRGSRQRRLDGFARPAAARPLVGAHLRFPVEQGHGRRARIAGRAGAQSPLGGCARLQSKVEFERARGKAEIIVYRGRARQCAGTQPRRYEPIIERHRAESRAGIGGDVERWVRVERSVRVWRRVRIERSVHAQRLPVPFEVVNPADAADIAEMLPRRRNLERAHHDEEMSVQRPLGAVLEAIAYAHFAVLCGLRLHRQTPLRGLP